MNRIVTGNGKKVKLKFRDVAWIEGNQVTVIGKPYSHICAGSGRQTVFAGKGTSFTDTGAGSDKIVLHPKSNENLASGGLGDDEIVGSRGHDNLYGSWDKPNLDSSDSDRIRGGGGNDNIYDYSGAGNHLVGQNGSDHIRSLGSAVSQLRGGNGSDFLYSNGGKSNQGALEQLFGEQGNDRLLANQPGSIGPAFLDGGEGDDQVFGTSYGDTVIYNSGIKRVFGFGGNDLFVTTGRGQGKFEGGSGSDTISFAAHTPSERPGSISGVKVDLEKGSSLGVSGYDLKEIENVIGSAFDDQISGSRGEMNNIRGGLGDDEILAQGEDFIDGGLGNNDCVGGRLSYCNDDSPGNTPGSRLQVDISEGGLLVVMGSNLRDEIMVGYDRSASRFLIEAPGEALVSGLCARTNRPSEIACQADRNNLNGILVYGDAGDDSIKLNNSVPSKMTSTLNGGTGSNRLIGGPSKDFISTAPGSAGSWIDGRQGLDVLYATDEVSLTGGLGTDIFRVVNPCLGAKVRGGRGTDSVVFAGATRGVKANLAEGFARWRDGRCSDPTEISLDIEKLEGTDHNDWLTIGKRNKTQDGRSVVFGRGGIDILDAKNGSADTITTGAGGRRNTVIADKKDRTIWGYGLAGYGGPE